MVAQGRTGEPFVTVGIGAFFALEGRGSPRRDPSLSPTVRLFDWPQRIDGIQPTLEFIQLTIARCRNITYRMAERAVLPDGTSAYTRILFEWDVADGSRVRSTYVVLYRYRDGLIGQQELYYDPSGQLQPVYRDQR